MPTERKSFTDEEALAFHQFPTPGKIAITPTKPMATSRDLSYYAARRASAQLVERDPDSLKVQFGSLVTFAREDGRRQSFRIVGEDEADPAKG